MRAGPVWRSANRTLAAFAAVMGLSVFGLGVNSRADELDDSQAPAVGAKAEFIDEMIQKSWDGASIKPSPMCTDEEFLRRAYLDVLGRIPNVEEAAGFLSSKEKRKRAKLVEFLVNHPDFAKNFATQWSILLVGRRPKDRNVDKDALTAWLRQQFHANRPWNEVVGLSSVVTRANEKDETRFSHMALKPMTPEQLFDSLLTATAAHTAGGGGHDRRRDQWLNQFIFTFANDEEEEGSSFQGTIPQALMMMNGELMEKAVGGIPGSFLADLYERAIRQRKVAPPIFMVNNIYLAALSRSPSTKEMNAARRTLGTYPDTVDILEDVFWALLNSNEFILNH